MNFFSSMLNPTKQFSKFYTLSIESKIISFLALFIYPLHDVISTIILFLIVDMITSIYLQYKRVKKRCTNGSEPERAWRIITFWKIIRGDKILYTVEKMVSYSTALIICFILDYFVLRMHIDGDGSLFIVSITNAVFVLIMIAEAKSIMRNLAKITNNKIFKQIEDIITRNKNKTNPS